MRRSLSRILALLPGLAAGADIGIDPEAVVPEVGVGGRTDPVTGEVTISLDPGFSDYVSTLTVWLPATLAHELDHAERILLGPGLGDTLLEAMVSEGLADTFSIEAFPETPRIPWDHALSPAENRNAWIRAEDILNRLLDAKGHDTWFFGKGQLPRWTGYTLGYRIAASYLHAHPRETAARISTLAATRILAGSSLGHGSLSG